MKIFVFGLGAVGSNIIIQLMKQFPEWEYVGVDYDTIEERNIKTQAYFLEQVGIPKVHAIPIIAQRFSRKIKYTPMKLKIDNSFKVAVTGEDEDIIFLDCFDNAESRRTFSHAAVPDILHVGFSPQYTAEIIWHERYDVPNDVDPSNADICEADEATSFIHFVANFAVMVIAAYIKDKRKDSYIITGKHNIRRI